MAIRVDIIGAAEVKLREAANKLNRSHQEIVNILIELVDEIGIEEHISARIKKDLEKRSEPRNRIPSMIEKKKRWDVNF
jgi:hypothetical protein